MGSLKPVVWPRALVLDDGWEYPVQPRSTRWLLRQLAGGQWARLVLLSMTPESRELVESRLADAEDPFTLEHVRAVAELLVRRVAGVEWHAAVGLSQVVVEQGLVFEGWCVEHGFRPDEEPLYRVIAAVYRMLVTGCKDEEQLKELNESLWPTTKRPSVFGDRAPVEARPATAGRAKYAPFTPEEEAAANAGFVAQYEAMQKAKAREREQRREKKARAEALTRPQVVDSRDAGT